MGISSKIGIATTTFYDLNSKIGEVRARIAKRTIESAVKHGYEIIVVDVGSPKELLKEFKDSGARISIMSSKKYG